MADNEQGEEELNGIFAALLKLGCTLDQLKRAYMEEVNNQSATVQAACETLHVARATFYDRIRKGQPTSSKIADLVKELPTDLRMEDLCKAYCLHVLRASKNQVTATARMLGIARITLYQHLKDWGVPRDRRSRGKNSPQN